MRVPDAARRASATTAGALSLFLTIAGTAARPAASALGPADDRRQAIRHYEIGSRALVAERYREAADEFERAIRLDRLLVLAHCGLGDARTALREHAAAVRAYRGCRQAFHDQLASESVRQTESDQRIADEISALEDQRAIRDSGAPVPDSSRPLNPLNQIQQRLDWLRTFQTRGASADARTPPWISMALAGACFRNGDFSDAEREYKAALEVDPGLGEAHANLAVVCARMRRVDDAERELAAAVRSGAPVPDGLPQAIRALRDGRRQKLAREDTSAAFSELVKLAQSAA